MDYGPPRPHAIATVVAFDDSGSSTMTADGSPSSSSSFSVPASQIQTLVYSILCGVGIVSEKGGHPDTKKAKPNRRGDRAQTYPPEVLVIAVTAATTIAPDRASTVLKRVLEGFPVRCFAINTATNLDQRNVPPTVAGVVDLFGRTAYDSIFYIRPDSLVVGDLSSVLVMGRENDHEEEKFKQRLAAVARWSEQKHDGNGSLDVSALLLQPSESVHGGIVEAFVDGDTEDSSKKGSLRNVLTAKSLHADFIVNELSSTYGTSVESRFEEGVDVNAVLIWNYITSPKPWDDETSSGRPVPEWRAVAKSLWDKWNERCRSFRKSYRPAIIPGSSKKKDATSGLTPPPQKPGTKDAAAAKARHQLAAKRYKELRKNGMSPKEAMQISREESGCAQDDDENRTNNPGSKVAAMFGMT